MRKYSVLIADDEENVLKLLEKVMIKEGYTTYTASNGEQALKIINEYQTDIVITDIKMPGISGIELFSKIREIDPSISVIIMTAFATLETAIDALKMGAKDYITKPFNLDEVVNSVRQLVDSLSENESDNIQLKRQSPLLDSFFSSKSDKMNKVMEMIKQVADSYVTVMICGETGTGKELAAQAIHDLSSRCDKPFIKVNCGAIPDNLLESELFGYEKGAFTGANTKKPGRFELAEGGSIFLDEIGDISPVLQVKLLRVLQEKEFQRLGGTKTLNADVRIIAATNKNLEQQVKEKIMRDDFYYRINVFPIFLPPLRERKEDIELLVNYFLKKSSLISGRNQKKVADVALAQMKKYNWPGNIRELENIIERCVVVTLDDIITLEKLPENILKAEKENDTDPRNIEKLDDAVDGAEREIIIKTLRECSGNRTKASVQLGISRRSLHRKILKYNIEE